MNKIGDIPDYVSQIAQTLLKAKFKAFLVGGSLRDLLLNRNPHDFDIATNARPDQIEKLFPRSVATGARFGTITVLQKDSNGEVFDVEVTTFRSEQEYRDGRWPTKVEFSDKIENDLERRDFTINALALDLSKESYAKEDIIDLFHGLDDLEGKTIRAVGNPIDRLSEDGLRGLRACRLAANLNFSLDEELKEAIMQTLHVSAKVSMERVRDELNKLLIKSAKPSTGLLLMKETGLLNLFIPELLEGEHITQPKYHKYDVFEHALRTVDIAEDSIKWAALLHDIGKPQTYKMTDDGAHFYRHDKIGAQIAEKVLRRLRFSNAEIIRITRLIRWHMFYYPYDEDEQKKEQGLSSEGNLKSSRDVNKIQDWSDAAIRRFIRNVGGEDAIDDLIKLRIADAVSNPKSSFDPSEIDALSEKISEVRQKEMALSVSDLDITGHDLLNLGIEKGPRMREVMEALLEEVIEDPLKNRKDLLIQKAKGLI